MFAMQSYRQAVQMIDLLINEMDTPVAEIIERIQNNSNNASTGPTSGTVSPSIEVMQQQPNCPSKVGSSKVLPPDSSTTSVGNNKQNVWLQRAAKLQQQQKGIRMQNNGKIFLAVVPDFKPIEIGLKKLRPLVNQAIDSEELQKKAPGYARPTSSTRNNSPPNATFIESEKQRLEIFNV